MNIDDLFEIILSDNPKEKILINETMIFNMIPELEKCKGFNQNNPWHIYDVYEHTLNVISKVSPTLILRLSALFHDVGKPKAYSEDENGIGHFRGHWIESQIIFDNFANKYQLEEKLKKAVSSLILYHDKNFEDLKDEQNLLIIKQLDKDEIIDLFKLKEADLLSQSEKYHSLLNEYTKQKQKILELKQGR